MIAPHRRAAVLFSPGFEEIETVTIIDILRRGGVEVVAAATQKEAVLGAHGIRVSPDAFVADLNIEDFDAVILPGGMQNARTLAEDSDCQRLIREARRNERILGAICAAPIALASAGVIEGKTLTSHPVVQGELPPEGYVEERVVKDGKLITSRGPGTAMEFALTLVEELVGTEAAAGLAGPMMVRSSAPA